jgi:hypothetical protein
MFCKYLQQKRLAERVGFEPTYTLLERNSISSHVTTHSLTCGHLRSFQDKFLTHKDFGRTTSGGIVRWCPVVYRLCGLRVGTKLGTVNSMKPLTQELTTV